MLIGAHSSTQVTPDEDRDGEKGEEEEVFTDHVSSFFCLN